MENVVTTDVFCNLSKPFYSRFYAGKRVLITGHTGFKGSWLSLWLSELGAEVFGYSLNPSTEPNFFNACGVFRRTNSLIADVRNLEQLKKNIQKVHPEIIFHLAAQSLVRRSYVAPVETYETNVMGTVNLLEACRDSSVQSVIIITSDKCYENIETDGYIETDRLGGFDPYSSSKACAELIASAYRSSYYNSVQNVKRVPILATTRAGNVIGGGDWADDRLLPDCIRSLVKGNTVGIRNPESIRPWQHVLEPLRGYLLLGLKMGEEGPRYGEAWNFGPTADSLATAGEIAEKIIKFWGSGKWEKKSILGDRNFHEAKILKLNIEKAEQRLGWKPVLNLDQSLKMTVDWYKMFYQSPSETYRYSIKQINDYENLLTGAHSLVSKSV